jgi:hypothetical protein
MTEKKRKPWVGIVRFLALVAVVGCLVLGAIQLLASQKASVSSDVYRLRATATATPRLYTVEYRLSGTAYSADITIENENGNTEQHSGVLVGHWSKEFTAEVGQFVYLSAQNQGKKGTIGCKILVDGEVWQEAESSGSYAIASCSGSVGR